MFVLRRFLMLNSHDGAFLFRQLLFSCYSDDRDFYNSAVALCDHNFDYYRQREKAKQTDGSPVALFNMFIQRCRDQLHIVLAMSPIGDAFRNRLRKFPSLVNCCTIDWFQVCLFL